MNTSAIDWTAAGDSLGSRGFALLPGILCAPECESLIALYANLDLFRSRIDMARFRFGRGEYQYFRYPLPPLIERLRQELYPQLSPIANRWAQTLGTEDLPTNLDELTALCHRRGQQRPTPLLLHYKTGDYNCLHQDVYGETTFPLQVVVFLSEPETDYTGGEFLLTEQIPRAQSMGRVLRPRQGDAVVITTRYRPTQGKRGAYRVNVRHGVSEVTGGERWTLGIIFHDAE
ncbi:MAG: 2OG-Fe(II) oxygenase [Bryobacteraceae bacterium]